LAHGSEHDEHLHEPDLHRLREEIQLREGQRLDEANLQRAIDTATAQNTKTLEATGGTLGSTFSMYWADLALESLAFVRQNEV
jgi:hypothetical protein